MDLLSRDQLIKTSSRDQAQWNYKCFLGFIQRLRFKLVIQFLAKNNFDRILEIGYGSGIFLPQLYHHCEHLYGIDLHTNNNKISAILADQDITADLFSGTVEDMPFESSYFDCIIAISTLEFINDLNSACREIKRILQPNGIFITVTPGYSTIIDFGLKVLTGRSPKEDFQNRRQLVIPTLQNHFMIKKRKTVPPAGQALNLYTALLLTKNKSSTQMQTHLQF